MGGFSDDAARLIAETADSSFERPAETIDRGSFSRLIAADVSDVPDHGVVPMRDGLPLAVRRYGSASHRFLILVHGAGGHGVHFHGLARAIADRGVASVVVPDMRGNGLSGARRADAVRHPDQLRDDLVDLVEAVAAEVPDATVVLAGHSAGGGVVLRAVASEGRHAIAGVVLLAPLLAPGPPMTRPGLGGWVSLDKRRVRALGGLNRLGISWLNDLTVMEFEQPPATRDGLETLSWSFEAMRAYGPANWKLEMAAAADGRPCVLLIGDRDECFVPEAYPDAVACVAPDAKVEILPDLGHWDLLVAQETVDRIASLLAAVQATLD